MTKYTINPPIPWPGPVVPQPKPKPTPPNPKPPKPPKDYYSQFIKWAATQEDQDLNQLIATFAAIYHLTQAEIDLLASNISKKGKPKTKPKTPKTPKVEPKLIITRTTYPRHWDELLTKGFNIIGATTAPIISPSSGSKLFIGAIVLTVTDETNINITFGIFGASGAMHFGGDGGPKGIVMAFGDSPAPCGAGGLTISSDSITASVGGFVTYYNLKNQT